MIDYFAILELPRHPLINAEELKTAYHRHAAQWHPDASAGNSEEFRKGAAAYETLSVSASRLKHLQQLCWPDFSSTPGPLFPDVFMTVALVLQKAQGLKKRQESAHSALAKALLIRESGEIRKQIAAALQQIRRSETTLEEDLRRVDGLWPEVKPEEISRLSAGFRFVARWRSELEEADFLLSQGNGVS